jgi:hypothetical protein
MKILSTDYQKAREVDGGLFAVKMTTAVGLLQTVQAPRDLSRKKSSWPVITCRFVSRPKSKPQRQSDAVLTRGSTFSGSDWTRHCIAVGGALCDAYAKYENMELVWITKQMKMDRNSNFMTL